VSILQEESHNGSEHKSHSKRMDYRKHPLLILLPYWNLLLHPNPLLHGQHYLHLSELPEGGQGRSTGNLIQSTTLLIFQT